MNIQGKYPGDPGEYCEDGVVFEAKVLSEEESAEVDRRFAAARAVAVRESGVAGSARRFGASSCGR